MTEQTPEAVFTRILNESTKRQDENHCIADKEKYKSKKTLSYQTVLAICGQRVETSRLDESAENENDKRNSQLQAVTKINK